MMQQDSISRFPLPAPSIPRANAPYRASSHKRRCNAHGVVKRESSTLLTGFSLHERIPEQTRQKGDNTQETLDLGGGTPPPPKQQTTMKKAVGQCVVSKE